MKNYATPGWLLRGILLTVHSRVLLLQKHLHTRFAPGGTSPIAMLTEIGLALLSLWYDTATDLSTQSANRVPALALFSPKPPTAMVMLPPWTTTRCPGS